jgi:hypothetical protein
LRVANPYEGKISSALPLVAFISKAPFPGQILHVAGVEKAWGSLFLKIVMTGTALETSN